MTKFAMPRFMQPTLRCNQSPPVELDMLNMIMKGVRRAHGADGGVISINFSGTECSQPLDGRLHVDKHDKKNRTQMLSLRDTTGDGLVLRHGRSNANRNLTFR